MAQLFRQMIGWDALRFCFSPPPCVGQQTDGAETDQGEGGRFRHNTGGGGVFDAHAVGDGDFGDAIWDGEGSVDLLSGGIERVVSGRGVIGEATEQVGRDRSIVQPETGIAREADSHLTWRSAAFINGQ